MWLITSGNLVKNKKNLITAAKKKLQTRRFSPRPHEFSVEISSLKWFRISMHENKYAVAVTH